MDEVDRRVLGLLAEGRRLEEVAAALQLNLGALKRRLHRLRKELDASSNINAVVNAIRRGEL